MGLEKLKIYNEYIERLGGLFQETYIETKSNTFDFCLPFSSKKYKIGNYICIIRYYIEQEDQLEDIDIQWVNITNKYFSFKNIFSELLETAPNIIYCIDIFEE